MFRDLSASLVAIAGIKGKESEVFAEAHRLTSEAIMQEGYMADEARGWCMEYYNCPRFTAPDENGEVILDYYITLER